MMLVQFSAAKGTGFNYSLKVNMSYIMCLTNIVLIIYILYNILVLAINIRTLEIIYIQIQNERRKMKSKASILRY